MRHFGQCARNIGSWRSGAKLARTYASSVIFLLGFSFLFCIGGIPRAHAAATLLLEEPYSYDGAFAGTGHVAVYLSNVCAENPVKLRACEPGESGVVLSRYDRIGGYDWAAIPLLPYLYAVEKPESVPLIADPKLVAFLRDQYRRPHLQMIAPDEPNGGAPEGNWYELAGSAYDRTVYGFEIKTNPEQDAALIEKLNNEPNREKYNFMRRNCADFVREIVNFYYPRALHRSLVGDLGVTTPKQIAKMMERYGNHHPELKGADFLVPQVPGAVRRSKPVHGVLESVLAAKKYMIPLVVLHPYVGGGLLVEHFGHKRFDPSRNDLVLDASQKIDAPVTREERARYLSRLDEMDQGRAGGDATKGKDLKVWDRWQASGVPALDAAGHPVLEMGVGGDSAQVGLSRGNIMSTTQSPELAATLIEARIRQELKGAAIKKTSRSDVDQDMALLQQLHERQAADVAAMPTVTKPAAADASTVNFQ